VLLIIASGRTASALISTGALLWVYGLTVFIVRLAEKGFPKIGKEGALVFLSAFLGSLFLLLLWFAGPLMALESAFLVILTPAVFISSGIIDRVKTLDPRDALVQALTEALLLGLLILALALIREPLGFGSLSLPGGRVFRFVPGRREGIFPIRIFAASSGALLLLGYGAALFRYYRNRYTRSEDE
jgi:hypothetical protein